MNGNNKIDESVSLSESLLPANIIENDYKMSYKSFVNKDFESSYILIKKIYKQSFRSFNNNIIDESLFVKIMKLYLTEIGLFVNQNNKFTLTLPKLERNSILRDLKNEIFLNNLLDLYNDDINQIPTELLFNLLLVNYSLKDSFTKDDWKFIYNQINQLYSVIDYTSKKDDVHLQKFINLYVFHVLVESNEFSKAKLIIETNPFFLNSISQSIEKLDKLRQIEIQEEKVKLKKAKEKQDREIQQHEKDLAKQRDLKEQQNLNFRSLKQIKDLQQAQSSSKNLQYSEDSPASNPSTPNNQILSKLLGKILYSYNLSKSYIKENSPIILLIIIVALMTTRFINVRKINLREKLKETIKMAFQISYL